MALVRRRRKPFFIQIFAMRHERARSPGTVPGAPLALVCDSRLSACLPMPAPIAAPPRLIRFYKPYGVLSQFTPEGRWRGLREFIDVPGVHAAGRLDADSEGLLLLTSDGRLQAAIAHPRHKLPKTYWAQVEGEPDEAALAALRAGVPLNDGPTRPAQARRLSAEPQLPPRTPPIRVRQHIPTSWIELVITEGRNRQVRRMTAAVGHPTLRLVRAAIGPYALDGLEPGCWQPASPPSPVPHHRKK